ncbi:MAG: hypothetical protein IJ859_10000 [Synergistaceae bacterium]|nr:hypothetical protein [Synergistaceae bacterium]MBR2209124.1 hypothetical protein [Synergistaceae bacterium]
MATKVYDCIVATGKYKDRNGQEKTKWENVGVIWKDTDNNGNSYSYLLLKKTFNPAGIEAREGSDVIKISFAKPKQQQQQAQQSTQAQQQQTQQQNNSFENFENLFTPENTNFGGNVEEIPFF